MTLATRHEYDKALDIFRLDRSLHSVPIHVWEPTFRGCLVVKPV
ncbi:MAG TPA: hypothetical protein VN224_09605 [Xanthomonadales bacterium]|nr:hypothetical protein [Xanthomonadales bacterium]